MKTNTETHSSSSSPLSPDPSTLTSHFPLCSEGENGDRWTRKTAWSGHNYVIVHFVQDEEKSLFPYTTFQKLSASSIVFLPGCYAKALVLPLLHANRSVTLK